MALAIQKTAIGTSLFTCLNECNPIEDSSCCIFNPLQSSKLINHKILQNCNFPTFNKTNINDIADFVLYKLKSLPFQFQYTLQNDKKIQQKLLPSTVPSLLKLCNDECKNEENHNACQNNKCKISVNKYLQSEKETNIPNNIDFGSDPKKYDTLYYNKIIQLQKEKKIICNPINNFNQKKIINCNTTNFKLQHPNFLNKKCNVNQDTINIITNIINKEINKDKINEYIKNNEEDSQHSIKVINTILNNSLGISYSDIDETNQQKFIEMIDLKKTVASLIEDFGDEDLSPQPLIL